MCMCVCVRVYIYNRPRLLEWSDELELFRVRDEEGDEQLVLLQVHRAVPKWVGHPAGVRG